MIGLGDFTPSGNLLRAVDPDGTFRCVQTYQSEPHQDSPDCFVPGYFVGATVLFTFHPTATESVRALAGKPKLGRIGKVCGPLTPATATPQLIAKLLPDLAKAPTVTTTAESPACTDARIELVTSIDVTHRFENSKTHFLFTEAARAHVTLRVAGRDVRSWELGNETVPDHCDKTKPESARWSLALDVACTNDVAVVTSGIFRGVNACYSRSAPLFHDLVVGCDPTDGARGRDGTIRETNRLRVDLRDGIATPLTAVQTPKISTAP